MADSTEGIDRGYVRPRMRDPDDDRDDDEAVEDEYDPFADREVDPPPKHGEEGDDRVHEGTDGSSPSPPPNPSRRVGRAGRPGPATGPPGGGCASRTADAEAHLVRRATHDEVRAFQKQHRLFVDGEVGNDTYGALASFYDARGVELLNSVKDASPDTIRRKIAKAAHSGFVNRDEIAYTQVAGARMEGIRISVARRTSPARPIARRSRSGATGRPAPRTRTTRGTAAVGPDPCCRRARRSRSTRPRWETSRSTARAVRTSAT